MLNKLGMINLVNFSPKIPNNEFRLTILIKVLKKKKSVRSKINKGKSKIC